MRAHSCCGPHAARLGVGLLLALVLAGLFSAERVAAMSCPPTWTTVAAPPMSTRGELYDVDALASDDAWAVGIAGTTDGRIDEPLVEHWDGSRWTRVSAATPTGAVHTRLFAVDGVSQDETWAVGETFLVRADAFERHPLIAHWDATTGTWSLVVRPDLRGTLYDVVALSPTNVWVVGRYDTFTPLVDDKPLIMHWDGSRWSIVPSPSLGYDSGLTGIAALSPTDIWAVGSFDQYLLPGTSGARTMAQHWDGTEWRIVPTPVIGPYDRLRGVAAISSSDVWAVGGAWALHGNGPSSNLLEHWDGSRWTVISDTLSRSSNASSVRSGVAAAAPGDVWAVGANPLVAHWDGTGWTKVAVRFWEEPSRHAALAATAATPSGDFWAVGGRHRNTYDPNEPRPHITRLCPIAVSDAGFEPARSTVPQGSDVAWSMPATNTGNHGVFDASGMGLFDSSVRPPGSSYTATLIAAGRYSVGDHASSATGVIDVPVRISPRRGSSTTTFKVTWASEAAPASHVFDVQLKRPSAAAYANWQHGTTVTSADFTTAPPGGKYSFRARLRNTSNKHAAGWSPATVITVE